MIELQVFQFHRRSQCNQILLSIDQDRHHSSYNGIDKLQITEDSNVSILYNSIGDGNMLCRHEDYHNEKLVGDLNF